MEDLEELKRNIEYLDNDQAKVLNDIIKVFSSTYIDKDQVFKIADCDTTKIDTALPIDYVRAIQELYPDFNTGYYGFDYSSGHGRLLNMAEKFIQKLHKTLSK